MEGRREKRNTQSLTVLISCGARPLVAEYASTENVSPYGVRVRTDRPWRLNTRVFLKSSHGEVWARARVVYCRTLQAKRFAVGLEFLSTTHEWTVQK